MTTALNWLNWSIISDCDDTANCTYYTIGRILSNSPILKLEHSCVALVCANFHGFNRR